jgi:hypothetical protein
MAVERNRLPDNIRAPSVGPLPKIVAQNGCSGASSFIVGCGQRSAKHRVDAERFEILTADPASLDVANFPTGREIVARPAVGEKGRKYILSVADLLPERIGEHVVEAGRSPHLQQLLGMADGQSFEHHRIDEAEDRGVGSDAEGEGKNRDGGEARGGAKGSEGVAEVLEECVWHIFMCADRMGPHESHENQLGLWAGHSWRQPSFQAAGLARKRVRRLKACPAWFQSETIGYRVFSTEQSADDFSQHYESRGSDNKRQKSRLERRLPAG